jgi:hypothetical protein
MKSGMLILANRVKCVANMPISQRNTNIDERTLAKCRKTHMPVDFHVRISQLYETGKFKGTKTSSFFDRKPKFQLFFAPKPKISQTY